jgi:hypothetical protein
MKRFLRHITGGGEIRARLLALGWSLVLMMLTCYPGRAEIVQTNWVRQFGLGTLNGAIYSPKGDYILTYGGVAPICGPSAMALSCNNFTGVTAP